MEINASLMIILGVVNIPVYLVLGSLFFGSWGNFWECIIFWFKPDLWSAFDGEFFDDWFAELKLGIFIAACGACVYAEYALIDKYFMS